MSRSLPQEVELYLEKNKQRLPYFGSIDMWNDGVMPAFWSFAESLGLAGWLEPPENVKTPFPPLDMLGKKYFQEEFRRWSIEADRVEEHNLELVSLCQKEHPRFFYHRLLVFCSHLDDFLVLGLCLQVLSLHSPEIGAYDERGENSVPKIDPFFPCQLRKKCLWVVAMESHPRAYLTWSQPEARLKALKWEKLFFEQ